MTATDAPAPPADAATLALIEKGLWGSPAGKGFLAKRLAASLPEHHTYVEPFAGGAAVFFAKEPSPVEVLADTNPDIMAAFRFVKTMTTAQLADLKRRKWTGDKAWFLRLRAQKPTGAVDRFYRFAYLAAFSFNALREKGPMPSALQGRQSTFMGRLEKLAPRLRKVVLRQGDYEPVVREFDGARTLHFLDPPYPGYDAAVGHAEFDEAKFRRVLERIKGKFLVTYGIRGGTARDLFKGYHVQRWRHISGVGAGPGKGMRQSVTLVVTNFEPKAVAAAKRELPALKMPDPAFLIGRLKARKFAGLLSAVDRRARVGAEQLLVNERIKEDEPIRAFGIVRMRAGVTIPSMAALGGERRAGLDKITLREFVGRERAGQGPFILHPLTLVAAFDPPRDLERPPPGRRFAAEVVVPTKRVHGAIAVAQPPRLRALSDARLREVDAALHRFFGDVFAGSDRTSADGVSREDVVNAHAFVVAEFGRRTLAHAPDDALTRETRALRKADERSTAPIRASGEGDGEPIALADVLGLYEKPIVLSRGVVTVVGSCVNQGASRNDVDLVLRESALSDETAHILRFRLGRAAPPEISGRLSFHPDSDFPSGAFTDHVEMYDLVLMPRTPRELVRMRDAAAKQDDPLLDRPRPGPRPMVLQQHFRGRSLHWDLRLAVDERPDRGFLVGWTVAVARAGAIPEGVDTQAEAARVFAGWSRKDGNRSLKPALAPARLFATPKSRQPLAWLDVVGRIEAGEVGATRNLPGFFHVLASTKTTGMRAEWGTQESRFHEYFLTGRPHELAGTLLFRQLVGQRRPRAPADREDEEAGRVTPPGQAFWTMAWAKNPLPSVLRKRAVERKRMPPVGRSWLPQDLEKLVPRGFRYWKQRNAERARRMRDALVAEKFLTEDNVRVVDGRYRRVVTKRYLWLGPGDGTAVAKQPRTTRFTLSWQFFKGQAVTRVGPTRQFWWLVLDRPGKPGVRAWRLQTNPLTEAKQITAVQDDQRDKTLLTLEGDQKPGTRWNPTKATPSTVRILDRGPARVLDERAGFVRVQFAGRELKGSRALIQEEPGAEIWAFQRSGPGEALGKQEHLRVPGIKDRTELRPLQRFTPMKPADKPGAVFFNVADALERFASPKALHDGVFVEPKWNGWRIVISKRGGRALIFFEDTKIDRVRTLPNIAKEVLAVPGDFVLDGELIDRDRRGRARPRRVLARFGQRTPQDDSRATVHVFHVLFWDKARGNLTDRPLTRVREAVDQFFRGRDFRHLRPSPAWLAKTPAELRAGVRRATRIDGSEGAMFKLALSTYTLGGETSSWAKLKLARKINAIVLERIQVKERKTGRAIPGVFNFIGGVGPLDAEDREAWDPDDVVRIGGKAYAVIGKTFNAKMPARVGEIIEVSVIELRHDTRDPGRRTLTWFQPRVVAHLPQRRRPDSLEAVLTQLRPGETQSADAKRTMRVVKSDRPEEERFVLGVVLEPEVEDSQGDIYSAEAIRKACHAFMEDARRIGLMHRELLGQGAVILENYIAPADFRVNGERIRAGSWLQGLRIRDDGVWDEIRSGHYTGLSIGGSAIRVPESAQK